MSIKYGFLGIFILIGLVACSNQNESSDPEEIESESNVAEESETEATNDQDESSQEENQDDEENDEEEEEKEEENEEEGSSGYDFSFSNYDFSFSNYDFSYDITVPEISVPDVTVNWNNEKEEVKMEVPDHLLFDFDESTLRDDAESLLEEISGELEEYEDADVAVNGHTDDQGDASYNQTLSEERAEAVKDYFLEQDNISSFDYTTEGFGESEPIVSNDSEENREKNRRVEIIIQSEELEE
ncbi:OmpA family protein [Salibacterium salarium]|uniref:OmpA family protein n=1 Tax=Salibacterium salarium TaxID=284579 RepID=A0A428N766_9BACI|nr:OmpA family protein [Salibacterium salarium]RSL34208.1 OmpA family protein [Salibacterium salarium]